MRHVCISRECAAHTHWPRPNSVAWRTDGNALLDGMSHVRVTQRAHDLITDEILHISAGTWIAVSSPPQYLVLSHSPIRVQIISGRCGKFVVFARKVQLLAYVFAFYFQFCLQLTCTTAPIFGILFTQSFLHGELPPKCGWGCSPNLQQIFGVLLFLSFVTRLYAVS